MNSQKTNLPPSSTVAHSSNVPDSASASSTISSNDLNFHFIMHNANDGDEVHSILRTLAKDYPKFQFWIGTGLIDCSTTVPSSKDDDDDTYMSGSDDNESTVSSLSEELLQKKN